MKKIYYLKPDYIQAFESVDEIISWTYKTGKDQVIFSTALYELIEKYYNMN